VGLSYLICRILDSVEDAQWLDRNHQAKAFEEFISFLKMDLTSDPGLVEQWAARVIGETKLPEHEILLMNDAGLVFQALWSERPRVREAMVRPIESMARGMMEYSGLQAKLSTGQNFAIKLKNLGDVNRYCFFVAGVVGEILNGLLKLLAEDRGVRVATSLVEGFRFGLFLQKVNLLKDRDTDLQEGRDLVPSRFLVFQSAFQDARKAFSYLSSIPVIFESYRLFCGWSLFLGLASLPHIASGRKIGRLETLALLASVESRVNSNIDLEALFEKYLNEAVGSVDHEPSEAMAVRTEASASLIEDYRRNYVGVANDQELQELVEGRLS
jgi:phytoene/squalene synthetase